MHQIINEVCVKSVGVCPRNGKYTQRRVFIETNEFIVFAGKI